MISWFEGTPNDIAVRYANIVNIMWFSSFYFAAMPVGCVTSLIALIMLYWIFKVVFFFLKKNK